MHALIFRAPGAIAVDVLPDPTPGPGEVRLRVAAASVCASDLRVYRGEKHAVPGVVPGHEFTGAVDAVGPGVDGLREGDRVVVYPVVACGGCEFCRQGLRNRCLRRRTLGYDCHGGLAEYVLLPEPLVRLGHVFPVPDGVPDERAALTEPTACVLNSLESCGLRAGASVAVLGAGPMGLLHVLLARALGAGPIIVAEPVAPRRAAAQALGATLVCGGDATETETAVRDATAGRGADIVIVSVGLEGLTERALRLVARRGAVNLFAGFPPGTRAAVDVNALHYDEGILTGTQNARPDQFQRVTALLPALSQIERVITHRFAMPDAARAYAVRADPAALKTMVLPHPPEGTP